MASTTGELLTPMPKIGNQEKQPGDLVYAKPDGPTDFVGLFVSFFEGGPFSHVGLVTDNAHMASAGPKNGVGLQNLSDYANRQGKVLKNFRGNKDVVGAANALAKTTPKMTYGFFGNRRVCSTTTASAINKGGHQGWAGIGPNAQFRIFNTYGE